MSIKLWRFDRTIRCTKVAINTITPRNYRHKSPLFLIRDQFVRITRPYRVCLGLYGRPALPLRRGSRFLVDSCRRRLFKTIDPFEGFQLFFLQGSPRAAPPDHLCFVKAVDGLGQSVVIALPTLPWDGSMPAFTDRSV